MIVFLTLVALLQMSDFFVYYTYSTTYIDLPREASLAVTHQYIFATCRHIVKQAAYMPKLSRMPMKKDARESEVVSFNKRLVQVGSQFERAMAMGTCHRKLPKT